MTGTPVIRPLVTSSISNNLIAPKNHYDARLETTTGVETSTEGSPS